MPAFRSIPLSVLGVVAAAILLAGVAAAQVSLGPRVGPGVAEVRLVERNAEKLELDEKTLEAVKALATEARAQDEKFSEQMREERLKLGDLLNEALPEEAALMKQATAINNLALDMQKHQLKTSLSLRKLLAPEQREELMELRKNVRPQRRRRPR
jgi:Spy/CpxP family protein refolding chaperone